MNFPIQHLSFSALKTYLSNPAGFYRQYVLMERTDELSPAALVGRTIHKYMECYYRGLKRKDTQDLVQAFFAEQSQLVTDWGKTGSPEKAKGEVLCAIRDLKKMIAKKKLPNKNAGVLFVEEPFEGSVGHACELKAIPDLVTMDERGIHIFDWKKVSAFNLDSTPALYWIQAYFNMRSVEAAYGPVKGMTFVEVKPLKEAGQAAVNLRYIPNDNSLELRAARRLVDFMLEDLSGEKRHFLGNVCDMYAGDDEWAHWLEETKKDPVYSPGVLTQKTLNEAVELLAQH